MSEEETVGLHPHKAAVLASALRASSAGLDHAGRVARAALAEAMEDDEPIVAVLRAGEWLDAEASLLQRIIDEIWQAELTGRGASSVRGAAIFRAPYAAAFDDPVDAVRAAADARDALRATESEGDAASLGTFARLASAWRDNPVFATSVVSSYVVADVADLLRRLDENHAAAPDDQRTIAERSTFGTVLSLMATASLSQTLPWSFDDLARDVAADFGHGEQGDDVVPRGARQLLALLFTPDAVWDAGFLLDATRQIVLPANQQARDDHVPQDSIHGDDPRALVLAAVARNPLAAQRVVNDLAPDDVLSAANAYDDGGRALGEVLVAATTPGEGHHLRAARRLFEWTAAHRDLPPLALDRLGAMIVPYLGSFRTASFDDDHAVANPLPTLSPDDRRGLLAYAASRERSAAELRTGELLWARVQFDHLTGDGYDGRGVGVIAGVDANVSDAFADGALGRAKDADERDAIERRVWTFLIDVAAGLVPVPTPKKLVEVAVEKAIELGAETALDHFHPEPLFVEHFAEHAREQVRYDEAHLEMLFIASLWQQRALNHAFDEVPLPPELLTGDPPRVKAFVEMRDDELQRYLTWKQDDRVKAATHWQELASWGTS